MEILRLALTASDWTGSRIVQFRTSKAFMPRIVCTTGLRNRKASRLHVIIPSLDPVLAGARYLE